MKRVLALVLATSACLAPGVRRPAGVPVPPTAAGEAVTLDLTQRLTFFGGAGPVRPVDVQGQPFAEARAATTTSASANAWDAQMVAVVPLAIEAGDVLSLRFWIRGEGAAGAPASSEVVLERAGPPHTKAVTVGLSPGPDWQQVQVPFQAPEALPAGKSQICFRLAYAAQTIEIGGLTLTRHSPGTPLASLPRTRRRYAGDEPEAPWRKEADARIAAHRQADLRVEVREADGRPVPGADVRVEMQRHAFGFGSAVTANWLTEPNEDGQRYRAAVAKLFNRAVFENDLKINSWQGLQKGPSGVRRRKALDDAFAWLQARRIDVRGHVLVWPGWRNLPGRFRGLEPAALDAAIMTHIDDIAGSLKGRILEWDVINEPFDNHDVMDILGNEVMARWFARARAADPKPRLFINDYAIIGEGGRNKRHQDHYAATIEALMKAGAPLDGIGLQGHMGGTPTPPARVYEILERYAAFGKTLEITEFDTEFGDDELEAQYLGDLLTIVFSHPAAGGFMMWGFWDGAHWKRSAPLLRKDFSEKPGAAIWRRLVYERWWTRAQQQTGPDGRAQVRAFQGEHLVRVSHAGRSAEVRVQLEGAGATAVLTLTR